MPVVAKKNLDILEISFWKKNTFWIIIEGELFFRTQPTTFLQIFFWYIMLYSIIFKSVIDADNNFQKES